ncbi:MAG: hypothetical protein F6K48_03215 [Okeania sp. SIO3H1]|nr:hypothetical protein [Okeania sp. SIO3H1]
MQRDMSSPMDASLSTRNQGQLVSTQQVVTQTRRVGSGMREVPLEHSQARRIARGSAFADRPAPGMNQNTAVGITRGAGFGVSKAQGLSDITVTSLGTTSLKWIGVSMVAGIVLWKLTLGARSKAKARTAKAMAALKGG